MMSQIDIVQTLYYIVIGLGIGIPPLTAILGKKNIGIAVVGWISVITATIADAFMVYATRSGSLQFFQGSVVHDKFTAFINLGAALAAIISLIAASSKPLKWPSSPAYYSLMPLVLFGVFVVSGATNAFIVLASWLLLSVLAYVYIALPFERNSRAAAVRYILLGAVATLFLAVWVALNSIMASYESLQTYFEISVFSAQRISGLALMAFIAALGFKMGVVPFHWWLPSVYGRARGSVVAVVAGVIKLGFIALFARVIYMMAGGMGGARYLTITGLRGAELAALAIAVLSVATMTYGNIAALTTDRLRALLAYSSIAHIGYILAAVAALVYFQSHGNPGLAGYALAAIAVQTAAYGIAKSALFPLADNADSITELRGLFAGDRQAGVAAAILLLSLLGMPPMLGFWGKLFMFIAVAGYSVILVIAAFINSAVSSGYYARVARDLLSGGETARDVEGSVRAALIIGALLILALGLVAPAVFLLAY